MRQEMFWHLGLVAAGDVASQYFKLRAGKVHAVQDHGLYVYI